MLLVIGIFSWGLSPLCCGEESVLSEKTSNRSRVYCWIWVVAFRIGVTSIDRSLSVEWTRLKRNGWAVSDSMQSKSYSSVFTHWTNQESTKCPLLDSADTIRFPLYSETCLIGMVWRSLRVGHWAQGFQPLSRRRWSFIRVHSTKPEATTSPLILIDSPADSKWNLANTNGDGGFNLYRVEVVSKIGANPVRFRMTRLHFSFAIRWFSQIPFIAPSGPPLNEWMSESVPSPRPTTTPASRAISNTM